MREKGHPGPKAGTLQFSMPYRDIPRRIMKDRAISRSPFRQRAAKESGAKVAEGPKDRGTVQEYRV